MTPDDERAHSPTGELAAEGASEAPDTGSSGDDLESLAGALPSLAPLDAQDADEEVDLGALAASGGRRPKPEEGEGESRLSLGELRALDARDSGSAEATMAVEAGPGPRSERPPQRAAPPPMAQAAPRARAAWLLPLLLGLGLGAGVAAAVFATTAGRAPIAGAARDPQAASPATHTPDEPAAAGEALQTARQPAIAPAQAPSAAVPTQTKVTTSTARGVAPTAPSPADGEQLQPTPAQPVAAHAGKVARTDAASAPRQAAPAPEPANSRQGAVATEPNPAVQAAAPDKLAPAAAPATAEANAKASPTRSVDALLDEALAPSARRQELARAQQTALEQDSVPLTPSREDVTQAMTVLLPAIRGCAQGRSGLAMANLVVRGDGKVAGVEIANAPFAGTAAGRCMEGVIRRARFSRFKQPTLRIKFPLAIQ